MRLFFFIFVFLIGLTAALTAFVPLSFAMKQSGIVSGNVTWQQARGTIWDGQVTGLMVEGQPAGTLALKFAFTDVLRGQAGHDIVWSGPAGRGTAHAVLKPDGIHILNGRAEVAVDVSRVSSRLPQHEAVLRITNADLTFSGTECQSAEGQVATQGLSGITAGYGVDWPELSGNIRCDAGDVLIDLSGQIADGASIQVTASLRGGGRMELSDVPDSQVEALLLAGFTNQAGKFVFTEPGAQNRTQP